MTNAVIEQNEVQVEAEVIINTDAIKELSDLQLALVGGGSGVVVLM